MGPAIGYGSYENFDTILVKITICELQNHSVN